MMNPLGPHFYVNAKQGDKPPDLADLVTDRMNRWLTKLNEDYEWEVTHEHIKPKTPICRIEWYPDFEGYGRNYDVNLNPPRSVSMEWYTRESNPVGDDL